MIPAQREMCRCYEMPSLDTRVGSLATAPIIAVHSIQELKKGKIKGYWCYYSSIATTRGSGELLTYMGELWRTMMACLT